MDRWLSRAEGELAGQSVVNQTLIEVLLPKSRSIITGVYLEVWLKEGSCVNVPERLSPGGILLAKLKKNLTQ